MLKDKQETLCEGEEIQQWMDAESKETQPPKKVEGAPQSESEILAQQPQEKKTAKEIIKKYLKRYFIDAFTGMAQGLFCTFLCGQKLV